MKRFALLFIGLLAVVICAGCLNDESYQITGTWEWSDGKNYTERYTFNKDNIFTAEALGSTFSGTWKEISPSHFMVTYCNDADPTCMEPFTETVLYDKETDEIFFPSHQRVR